jgi:hypothetical protein
MTQHKVTDLRGVPLDELPLHGGPPYEMDYYSVMFEFQKRQTEAQIESAKHQRKSVFWMAVSVVVLTLASVASFVLALLTFMRGAGGGLVGPSLFFATCT